jgi:hypothetical protein
MENMGTFSNKLVYIGSLIQADLHYNAPFWTREATTNLITRFLAYTGNRVNIYVMDQISNASRTATPGTKLGITVGWGFKGRVPGLKPIPPGGYPIVALREADWNGVTPIADTGPNPVNPLRASSSETESFGESKIEFGAYAVNYGGTGAFGDNAPTSFQLGDLAQNVYTFPVSNLTITGRSYCIPVVARADFLNVTFWCDPSNWVGLLPTDQVHIWAMAGGDAGGAQRIGGGHG